MRVTDKRYGEGRGPGALSVEPEMADFPTWDHVIGLLLENPRRIVEIDATDFVAFNGDGDSQTPGLSTVANRIKLEGFRRGLVTPANVVGEDDEKVVQATYRPLGESDNVPKWVLALQRAGHTQDLRDDFAQFLSENDDS